MDFSMRRDEDERKRQERRNEAFNQTQQQLTSVIMSLAANLTGQTPIVPRPESVAPAHPATADVPYVQAGSASYTTASCPTSLSTLPAEADCQVKEEEESCQHLAEVQVEVVESSRIRASAQWEFGQ